MTKKICLFVLILVLGIGTVFGQSEGDYRTRNNVTGDWNGTSTWQKYVSGVWADVTTSPTSADGVITIRSGATVTTTASVTVDQLIVSGKLIVGNDEGGGRLTISDNAGDDIVVQSSGTVELYGNNIRLNTDTVMRVYGALLDIGGKQIVYPGSFYLEDGATIQTKNSQGLFFDDDGDLYGLVACTGTKSFSTQANYVFASATLNQFARGLPSTVNTLKVILGNGGTEYLINLVGNVTITDRLVYQAGEITTGAYAISYASGATLEYGGLYKSQHSDPGCFPTSNGPTNLVINNSLGVTLHDTRTIAGNLILDNGAFNLNGKTLTVDGSTKFEGGSYTKTTSGSLLKTDGLVSDNITVSESATYLENPTVSTASTGGTGVVKRIWDVSVDAMGAKNVTLTWTAAEDETYAWANGEYPIMLWGNDTLTKVSFDGTSSPRTYVGTTAAYASGGTFDVENQGGGNSTLPVEFSGFNAAYTGQGYVALTWVTNSETNVQGFYLYRGESQVLTSAQLISGLVPATNTSTQQTYVFTDSSIDHDAVYYYWVQNVDMDGTDTFYGPISFNYTLNGGSGNSGVPLVTGITGMYPNPFNPNVTLQYQIKQEALVSFYIYNQKGQLVYDSLRGNSRPGYYSFKWEGKDNNGNSCPSGIYLFKMKAGNSSYTQKATLMK